MTGSAALPNEKLDPRKFSDPDRTATGKPRAFVELETLQTLWFNTGTLCNLTCRNCYIESSPTNDRLVYIRRDEVVVYLDEILERNLPTAEIGLTGGEPFMNPEIISIFEAILERGFRALVLTNAMRPMMRYADDLLRLKADHGDRLVLRVSLDHYTQALHELERGPGSWQVALDGLQWLADNGFALRVAGRTCWAEDEARERQGYARLFAAMGVPVDARDPTALVLFPEMDADRDVPEITEECWEILGVDREAVMCATSRMVVKRKGDAEPLVMPCTLLAYQDEFVLGRTLADAERAVKLNHPHCARFCVLGGGSCSRGP